MIHGNLCLWQNARCNLSTSILVANIGRFRIIISLFTESYEGHLVFSAPIHTYTRCRGRKPLHILLIFTLYVSRTNVAMWGTHMHLGDSSPTELIFCICLIKSFPLVLSSSPIPPRCKHHPQPKTTQRPVLLILIS